MTSPPPAHPGRSPRRLLLALVLVVTLAVTAVALVPRLTGDEQAVPLATPPPSPMVNPTKVLDADGYNANPGTFSLTDADSPADEPLTATLKLDKGASATGDLVGLSFEATDLASPVWGSESSNLPVMLDALDAPVLRFGGNAVDRRMFWTSNGEEAPDWADATVTPADLEQVAATAKQVGARVLLSVDLGHDDAARAADMVSHARDAFGNRLIGVAIGNEPNGFQDENQPQLAVREDGWGISEYTTELEDYAAAIEEAAPGTSIVGPGTFDNEWMRAYVDADIPDKTALTMHWYPLWNCSGPEHSIANPTVDDLTSPALRAQARKIIGLGEEVAVDKDLDLWMEETGPTSCVGTNETSRTHAQALWTSDYVLTAAENGVDLMGFHSTLAACEGGAPMSPICATGDFQEPGELLAGRTSFLALLQLAQIPEGRVLTAAVSGAGEVMVHAVAADDGTLTLVIVDLRDPASDPHPAPVQISAPSGLGEEPPQQWHPAQGSQLAGDSLDGYDSALGALAPVSHDIASLTLARGKPMTIASEPATTTVLVMRAVGSA